MVSTGDGVTRDGFYLGEKSDMWWVTRPLPMRQPKCTSSRCHQIFESAGKLSLQVHSVKFMNCQLHMLPCVHLLRGSVDGIRTKHQVK